MLPVILGENPDINVHSGTVILYEVFSGVYSRYANYARLAIGYCIGKGSTDTVRQSRAERMTANDNSGRCQLRNASGYAVEY